MPNTRGNNRLDGNRFIKDHAPFYEEVKKEGAILKKRLLFKPHPGQKTIVDFLKDPLATTCYGQTAAQIGKSVAGAYALWHELNHKGPGEYLVVAPHSKLIEAGVQPHILWLLRDYLGITDKVSFYPAGPLQLITLRKEVNEQLAARAAKHNGEEHEPGSAADTRIYFRHTEKEGSLQGYTAKFILFDECAAKDVKPNTFYELDNRASVHNAKRLYLTTPLHLGEFTERYNYYSDGHRYTDEKPYHKFNDSIWTFNSPVWLNPSQTPPPEFKHMSMEDYCVKELMPTMSPHEYDRRILGIATKSEGIAFDQFTEDCIFHAKLDKSVTSGCIRVAGYDAGTTNVGAVLGLYDTKRDIIYIIDEYAYNRHQAGHAAAPPSRHVRAMLGWNVNKMGFGKATPDKEAMPYFQSAGIYCVETKVKDVKSYVNVINDLFAKGKLVVSHTCQDLIQQLNTIAYDDKGKLDFQPYHCVDGLRYLVGMLWNPAWQAKMEQPAFVPQPFRPTMEEIKKKKHKFIHRLRPL